MLFLLLILCLSLCVNFINEKNIKRYNGNYKKILSEKKIFL